MSTSLSALNSQLSVTPAAGARPRAIICINGIKADPGDAEGWTDRAVTWLNLSCADAKSEKYEYGTHAVTRRFKQHERAEGIAKMAEYYLRGGFDIVFVAHSNGCDLVERVLELVQPYPIARVHLFAAACDGDILSRALERNQLERAFLYGSRNDSALKLAGVSRKLLGWIKPGGAPLGYGDLGRRVDLFAAQHAPRVYALNDDTHGHSSWFARGEAFEATMQLIRRNEERARTPAIH